MSEIDSSPEDSFSGKYITVKTPSQRGRTRTRGMNQQSRGRVWTREGMNRGVRTRFSHNASPTKPASVVADEKLSSDDQRADSEQEEDRSICSECKEDAPTLKTFLFNGRPCMKMNVPENADLMLFFGLMIIDDLVKIWWRKPTSMQTKTSIKIDHYPADLRPELLDRDHYGWNEWNEQVYWANFNHETNFYAML